MRKIIFLAIMVLAGCLTMPAQSNDFTVEVASVNSHANGRSYNTYHGVELNGGYQFNFLKRIYVEPQIGLTWLNHKDLENGPVGGGPGTFWQKVHNKSSLDIRLGATGGVKLCKYIGVFTGPDLRFNVWKEDLVYDNPPVKTTAAWWRFGLDVFVWKLRFRGSVGVSMNHPYYEDERNDNYTIGIAYQF